VETASVGLDRDHLLIVDVDVMARGYHGSRLAELAHAIRDRAAGVPGVIDVTYSENGIFSGTDWSTTITVPGFTPRTEADAITRTDNAGPHYVRAIGGVLLAGRDLQPADGDHPARVAVVNRSFAAFYFAGATAVGQYFRINDSLPISIVGVMADTRDHELAGGPVRRVYFPYVPTDSQVSNPTELRFAIRTADDPARHVEAVRKAVTGVDPWLPIDGIDPLPRLMRQSIRQERLVTQLASAFSLLALLLASAGLYAVMAYAVRQRSKELGLRAALGASRTSQLRLVLSNALSLVGVGLIVGLPLAIAAARLLRALLHGVPTVDPASIVIALLLLATSGIVAALLPAFVATRISPLVALRSE
jgi:predicted permease